MDALLAELGRFLLFSSPTRRSEMLIIEGWLKIFEEKFFITVLLVSSATVGESMDRLFRRDWGSYLNLSSSRSGNLSM